MVFIQLGLGLCTGIAFPMWCHENIYLTLATSFLRPHLKYRMEKDKCHEDLALSTHHLDCYVRDVIGSFGLFFAVIGPVCYTTYFKKIMIGQEHEPVDSAESEGDIEDRYALMI